MEKNLDLYFVVELRTGFVDGIYVGYESGYDQVCNMKDTYKKGQFVLVKLMHCPDGALRMPHSATENFFIFLAKYEKLPS